MKHEEIHAFVERSQPNIVQIVVNKDGKEVYADQWHGYLREDGADVMSVTKSVFSLLIGIAVDQGKIHSIDDKVLDYFPDYEPKRGEKTIQEVTIRHLLTMRAPYKCKGDPWSKVCISENWTKTSLDFLGGRKGLTDEFNYQTVCLHILTGILNQATGMTTVDFANLYLFEPLGITHHENFYARSAEEHRAFTLNKRPHGHVWFADRQDLGTPGYGLCMSAEDAVKIGQLCLDGGKCGARPIISESWIHEMTRPRPANGGVFDKLNLNYGLLWWITNPEKNIYAAIGNCGNIIYVNPEKQVTVAITAYFKPGLYDRVGFIENNLMRVLNL